MDLKSALDFSHLDLSGRHYVGSEDYGIAAALSVLNNRFSNDPFLLRYNFEPAGPHEDTDADWGIRARLLRKLETVCEEDFRQLFSGERSSRRLVKVELEAVYWGIFRSRCYDLLARTFHLPYLPHPLRARSELAVRCLDMKSIGAPNPFLAVLKDAHDEGRQYVYEKSGDWIEPFRLSPLFPFILRKCKNKEEILPRTYDIRDSRGARALRSRLATTGDAESLRDRIELVSELDSLKGMLASELGLERTAQKVSFNIAGMISTTLPVPETLTRFIGYHIPRSTNSRLLFLRNIYKEMTQAAGLGKYYEFLTRTQHKGEQLGFRAGDVKARAQYLHAIFLNEGCSPEQALRMTYRVLRQLTQQPAQHVHALMAEALRKSEDAE